MRHLWFPVAAWLLPEAWRHKAAPKRKHKRMSVKEAERERGSLNQGCVINEGSGADLKAKMQSDIRRRDE